MVSPCGFIHQLSYHFHEFFTIVTPERMSNPEFMKLLDVVHDNHNLNRLVVDEVRANPIYVYQHTLIPFFTGTLYFCKDVSSDNQHAQSPNIILNRNGDTISAKIIDDWEGSGINTQMSPLWLWRPLLRQRKSSFIFDMPRSYVIRSRVQRDIIKSLKLDGKYLFEALHPFNRSNLLYEVSSTKTFPYFLLLWNVRFGIYRIQRLYTKWQKFRNTLQHSIVGGGSHPLESYTVGTKKPATKWQNFCRRKAWTHSHIIEE